MARCILEVDTSDVQKKAYALAAMLSEQEGKAMLYAAFKRTGGHTRQIMKKDLPREYEIGATRVGQAVQNAKVSIFRLWASGARLAAHTARQAARTAGHPCTASTRLRRALSRADEADCLSR